MRVTLAWRRFENTDNAVSSLLRRVCLRGDDAAVGHGSRLVLVERELLGLLGGCDRGFLDHRLLFQDTQGDDLILDLLEAREDGLPVGGDIRIIGGARLRHLCTAQSAVEERLRQLRP